MPNDRTRCLSCRARHAKCIIRQGQDVCSRCHSLGRSRCVFESLWRFKMCKSAVIAAQRTDFVYRPSQPWISTDMKLVYIFENGGGLENNHDELFIGPNDEPCTNDQVLRSQNGENDDQAGRSTDSMTEPIQSKSPHTTVGLFKPPDTRTSLSYVLSSPSTLTREPSLTGSNTMITDTQAPDSSCTDITTSTVPPLTHREALLMQYFIRVISPWLDVLQDIPRFAQEVPFRATKSPMLLFSILAASSRHQAVRNNDWQEASDYHSKCLTLVIQALSQPDLCHDDTLMVTMVFLRLYELFNHQPFSALHLEGLASLLGAIPNFLRSGGLAEASAWLALRHDLFMAMMTKRAPRISLNGYDHSSVFQGPATPSAKAYAIILIWAKILRRLYSTEVVEAPTDWSNLERSVEDWYTEKDSEPLFQQDANVDLDQPFPIIIMTSAPRVVALEYYHTCQVYLNLYKPLDTSQDTTPAANDTRSQDAINSMCSVLGIALSNSWVEDAVFPGLHILLTCGHHFTDSLQRNHALRFLDMISTKFGYRTDRPASALKDQWTERDASKN